MRGLTSDELMVVSGGSDEGSDNPIIVVTGRKTVLDGSHFSNVPSKGDLAYILALSSPAMIVGGSGSPINIEIDLGDLLPTDFFKDEMVKYFTNADENATNNTANNDKTVPMDPNNRLLQGTEGKVYADTDRDGKYDTIFTDKGNGRWTASFDNGATSKNVNGTPDWVGMAYG